MADGKVVIETDLDSSGIEKGLSKLGKVTNTGLKAATVAISGTATALGGVSVAAVKTGSEFEAQMSRVKGISGATGKDFEKLREQAIQLGADTSFSASSAAEGMENLAAGGFEVAEITDAMPGLLALAAASGEDLAVSSDIAASAVRGFGLEAKDTAHVADVLAKNANKTNSSVSDTGEALKYVAPLAQAAGISFEETAAAVGIMADAGIQGSQAGTTLRGALSRISKPTKDMKEAMDELGISFYDSERKMKSLSEQVGMLRKATEGMTDEQRNNYLVTLYGQEALSGMLALINTGEDSLQELTAAYKNSDGAAQKAADTMQDNLAGAMEQLGGSAETLGIVFYDSVSDNLNAAAESATDSVNEITEAFQDGGLDTAIETAGDEFADLAVEVADHAPEMVDAAVEFIDSFGQGIKKNKKKLVKAAGDMAETVAGGLAKLLPDEIQEPVEDAIDAVSKSLSSGGLKKGAQIFQKTLGTTIDVVGDLAEVALPVLTESIDFVGAHMDVIIPILGGATAAWGTYKTATVAVATANKVATAAQTALNLAMNANPVALIGGTIVAAAAGLALYAANANQVSEEQLAFNKRMDELGKSIEENQLGLDRLRESIGNTASSIETSTAPVEKWRSKLNEVVDSTGKVKDGCEKTASYILNQLNEAMGTNYSITADGFIQNNEGVRQSLEDVNQSIDEYVLNLKQKSLQEATSSQFTEALQRQGEAQADLNAAQKEYNEAVKDYSSAMKEYMENGDLKGLETAQENLEKTRGKMTEATKAAVDATSQVSGLDAVMNKLAEGTPESVQEALDMYAQISVEASTAADGVVVSSEVIKTALKKAFSKDSVDLEGLTEGFQLAVMQIEESGGHISVGLRDSIQQALNEIDQLGPEGQESISESMRLMLDSMSEEIPAFKNVSKMTSEEVIQAFRDYLVNSGAMQATGKDVPTEFGKGVTSGKSAATNASKDVVEETADTAKQKAEEKKPEVTASGKKMMEGVSEGASGADTSSVPAQKVEEATRSAVSAAQAGEAQIEQAAQSDASQINEGYQKADVVSGASQAGNASIQALIDAISALNGTVQSATQAVGESAKSGLDSAQIETTFSKLGNKAASELGSGIKKNTKVANSAATSLGKTTVTALKNVKMQTAAETEGRNLAKGIKSGITSMNGDVKSAASDLAKQAVSGLKSANIKADAQTTGESFGNELSRGIKSKTSSVSSNSLALANAAKNALVSANLRGSAYGQGTNFSAGLASGIKAGRSGVISAAVSVAAAAAEASKRELDINSPSGETEEQGLFFDEGYVIGIKKDTDKVVKSVKILNEKMLNAVDFRSVSERMRSVMDMNVSRVVAAHYEGQPYHYVQPEEKEAKEVKQTINFNQPVSSPVETARVLRREARRLAFA